MRPSRDPWAHGMAELADRWRWTVEGTTAARSGASAAGIAFTSTPRVVDVAITGPDGPVVLTVQLLGGQLPADLAAVSDRLAEGMGVAGVRVTSHRPGYARVALLLSDPLAGTLPLDLAGPGLLLARGEDGRELRTDPVALPHVLVQGQTRSGKSTWLYGLLSQLVRHPHVEVAGIDPSGITLRPFAGTRHAHRQALGLGDLAAVEAVLLGLVADLDARLAAMPAHRDVLDVGPDWPLRIVVLEEWPALLHALDAVDPKQGKRVRALVARLLAESHKVGHRVVMAAQRAEAAIVGAAERAQCGGRFSFRVDSRDSVKLLHSDADALVDEHVSAPAGIALCSWPGHPTARVRGPLVGDYGRYSAHIALACRSADP